MAQPIVSASPIIGGDDKFNTYHLGKPLCGNASLKRIGQLFLGNDTTLMGVGGSPCQPMDPVLRGGLSIQVGDQIMALLTHLYIILAAEGFFVLYLIAQAFVNVIGGPHAQGILQQIGRNLDRRGPGHLSATCRPFMKKTSRHPASQKHRA